MAEKVEGTFYLDGLIEGPIPSVPDAEEKLRTWTRQTARQNLRFSLEVDGGTFSLLGSTHRVPVDTLIESPKHAVIHAMEELLRAFPPTERTNLVSTVHSIEYRVNLEVQTLYAIGPDGSVQTRQRNVETKTTAPPQPLSRKQKLKMVLMGLLITVALVGISAFFIDYRGMIADIVDELTPLDVTQIEVNTDPFTEYFTISQKTINKKNRTLVLTLHREAGFPLNVSELQRAYDQATKLPLRLTLEALAQGYVRCERFDKDGLFLDVSLVRIEPLRTHPTIQIELPLPRDKRLGRVSLSY